MLIGDSFDIVQFLVAVDWYLDSSSNWIRRRFYQMTGPKESYRNEDGRNLKPCIVLSNIQISSMIVKHVLSSSMTIN